MERKGGERFLVGVKSVVHKGVVKWGGRAEREGWDGCVGRNFLKGDKGRELRTFYCGHARSRLHNPLSALLIVNQGQGGLIQGGHVSCSLFWDRAPNLAVIAAFSFAPPLPTHRRAVFCVNIVTTTIFTQLSAMIAVRTVRGKGGGGAC